MTPEQKSQKLVKKFRPLFGEADTIINKRRAENAAIFCVDEILNFSKRRSFSISEDNKYLQAVKDYLTKQ